MTLLRPLHKNHKIGYEIIENGSFYELLNELYNLTEYKERNGYRYVGEDWISIHTVIRYFATPEKGLVDTLIICGGVVGSVKSNI